MKRKYSLLFIISITFLIPIFWDSPNPNLRYGSIALLTLAGLFWLLVQARERKTYRIPRFLLPLTVFLIFQAALLWITPLKIYGGHWVLSELVIMLCFIIVYDTSNSDRGRKAWENGLLVVGFLLTYFGLIYILDWHIQWWSITGSVLSLPPISTRASGLFIANPNQLAAFLNLMIPIALVRYLRSTRPQRRWFWAVILLLFLVVLYFTSSRGAWMSLAFGLAGMLVLKYLPQLRQLRENRRLIFRRKQPVLALLGFSVLGLSITPLVIRQIQLVGHGTLSQRLGIWGYAAKLITASPLWGYGPGSLHFLYTVHSQETGNFRVSHAHNLWLQIAGETGILGLLLILGAVLLILRAFTAAWRRTAPGSPERDALLAYAGVGLSLIIHSQSERLFWRPLYTTGVVIILTLMTNMASPKEFFSIRRKGAISLFIGLLVVFISGSLYYLQGTKLYWNGRNSAQRGDWEDASEQICRASETNPLMSFYDFQCSISQAMVAYQNRDVQVLSRAIDSQKRGLEKDPYWFLHWANLASFEWQQGKYQQAMEHMQKAVELAPLSHFLQFNLGWMEEQLGHSHEARENYHLAICLNPGYRLTEYFQRTPLRKQALRGICPTEYDSLTKIPALPYTNKAWRAYRAGDLATAEQSFLEAIRENPHNPLSYASLALVHQKAGQPEQAWMDVQIALFIDQPPISLDTLLMAAHISLAQGENERAAEYASEAFLKLSNSSLSNTYYYTAYQQSSLPVEKSPFYVSTGLLPEMKDSLLFLIKDLHQKGKWEAARQVSTWIERNTTP